jgi:hypothetical protein
MSTSLRSKSERGRGMAKLVDLVVDLGIFFDVGVRRGNICFWLKIVVVANKILDRIFWKKLPEFSKELGGKGFVVTEHQSRKAKLSDQVGHRKSLTRARHPEQDLLFSSAFPIVLSSRAIASG